MKLKLLLIAIMSWSLSFYVYSDPIEDLSMKPYKAGWYPNFFKREGPLTCPKACSLWTGARAEQEKSSQLDGQTRVTHVCKVTEDKEIITGPKNEPKSHWLYGNQFDSWAMCHVSTIGIEPFRSEYFMCLCVEPDSCAKPDLVVSEIADPVWDHPNGQSVVKVTVKNIGSSAAGGFYTSLTDPGTGSASAIYTGGLAAGSSTVLTFYFNYWVFDPDAELIAFVDRYDYVDECNEDNNKLRYFKLG